MTITTFSHYCLGNGASLKCDGCGQEKNWQTLNELPDELRKAMQAKMQRVDDTACILNGRPWYLLMPTPPADPPPCDPRPRPGTP